jgi:poly(3-hydroxyalkanoate) synthetase
MARDGNGHPDSWWLFWERRVSHYFAGEVPARHPGGGKPKPFEDAPDSYVKVRRRLTPVSSRQKPRRLRGPA